MTSALRFSLDTNICISILNETSEPARTRIGRLARAEFAVSSIVLFELHFGVRKSARFEQNMRVLRSFISRTQILEFTEEDAAEAGRLRNHLQAVGLPIGPYDVLIAAQANARSLTLATNNTRGFERVPGLVVEDWLAPL